MIYITRKEHFNAAHKLWREDWSEEKNFEVFGKCANKNWHGHNYTLYVTLKGTIDKETGYIANLKELSNTIKKYILDVIDHRNLNLDVPFMKGKMASTEILTMEIWKQLQPHVEHTNCKLHSVKLYETENNFAEYFGE